MSNIECAKMIRIKSIISEAFTNIICFRPIVQKKINMTNGYKNC